MILRIHIEHLVLDGPLSAADSRHVKTGLEQELARLLSDGVLHPELRAGAALSAVPAGALDVSRDATPRQFGSGIARAIHEGIARP
jgi:hypothetical protein